MADDRVNDPDISVEQRAALLLVEDLKRLPKAIAEINGNPPGVQHLTPDHELWAWNFRDETIRPEDIPIMRERGKSDVEIANAVFPLRRRLVEQGGVTYEEQEKQANRLAERAIRAQQRGHVPKPPPKPKPYGEM